MINAKNEEFLVYHIACKWHKSVFNYIIVALYLYIMVVIPYYCGRLRLSRNTDKLVSVFILKLIISTKAYIRPDILFLFKARYSKKDHAFSQAWNNCIHFSNCWVFIKKMPIEQISIVLNQRQLILRIVCTFKQMKHVI